MFLTTLHDFLRHGSREHGVRQQDIFVPCFQGEIRQGPCPLPLDGIAGLTPQIRGCGVASQLAHEGMFCGPHGLVLLEKRVQVLLPSSRIQYFGHVVDDADVACLRRNGSRFNTRHGDWLAPIFPRFVPSVFGAPTIKTLSILALAALAVTASAAEKPNVLFLASDDMRPQLGCYGDPTVKSPHLDALAKRGMVFRRSYVQQALCSPSRISMLSGRYPATTGIFEIGRTLRTTMPDITTLPQHFKNHGYHTRSLGKVYHVGIDDDASWTIPAWHSKQPRTSAATQAAVAKFIADAQASGQTVPATGQGSRMSAVPPFEAVDCDDDDLLDGDTAKNAIAQLREYAKNPQQSFFLAVGFANPHVPWIAPKRYFDLYDPAKLPLARNDFLPQGAPAFAATSRITSPMPTATTMAWTARPNSPPASGKASGGRSDPAMST